MRKSLVRLFGLLGLAAGLATSGCGGSGDTPGTYATALESCSAFCEAYFAAACDPTLTADGFCKIDMCSPIPSMASVGCYSATKTWYDCRKAQSNICADTGCTSTATAALDACP